jgi:hypothetical protein
MPADWPEREKYLLNNEAQIGWTYDGNTFSPPADTTPPLPPSPAQPFLWAAVALCVADGALTTIELAARLQGAIYDEGWLMVLFSEPQEAADYLVFAQTDVPAKIEQFKDGGSFELVFTDPATGDPVEPGRIDLQILKVR